MNQKTNAKKNNFVQEEKSSFQTEKQMTTPPRIILYIYIIFVHVHIHTHACAYTLPINCIPNHCSEVFLIPFWNEIVIKPWLGRGI